MYVPWSIKKKQITQQKKVLKENKQQNQKTNEIFFLKTTNPKDKEV
jgi:hypothetical protein